MAASAVVNPLKTVGQCRDDRCGRRSSEEDRSIKLLPRMAWKIDKSVAPPKIHDSCMRQTLQWKKNEAYRQVCDSCVRNRQEALSLFVRPSSLSSQTTNPCCNAYRVNSALFFKLILSKILAR